MGIPDLKVGFISDVHGCLLALEVAFRRLSETHGADTVVCLGDVASFGPRPNECVAFLRDLGVATVRGNSDDDMLLDPRTTSDATPRLSEIESIINWSRSTMTRDSKDWLGQLPLTDTIDDLLCVHASPNSNTEIVAQHDAKPIPDSCSIVLAGHLHSPFVDYADHGIWVNVGSIARPTDGDPRGSLAIASRVDGRWTVSIDRFELPLDDICESAIRVDIPHCDHWCQTLHAARWW